MSDIRRRTRYGFGSGTNGPPSNKRQKAKTTQRASQYLKSDLELLKTENFSDAVVACEGKEIKVHKAILVTRSNYFRGAFGGGFIEGSTGVVKLEDFEFDQIQRMIYFIYAGDFENEERNFTMADIIELIQLGDYFLVDGMVDHTTALLWSRLEPHLKAASKFWAWRDGAQSLRAHNAKPYQNVKAPSQILSEADFCKDFRAAVCTAYDKSIAIAQQVLADFTFAARGGILGSDMIEQLNQKYPEFGSQVFTVMNKGPQSGFLTKHTSDQMSADGPSCKHCSGCQRPWRWDRHPVYFDPMSLELRPARAFCQSCEVNSHWKP